jgi:hypothetical protein
MAATLAQDSDVLEGLLAQARGFSAEFPQYLASHLPMVLVALQRLGADDDRLRAWSRTYREVSGLVPPPPRVAPVGAADWPALLGQRGREADLRDFFTGEVARLGIAGAVRTYLPRLAPGIGASALHALMRLAYGVMRQDAAEVGTALGYWAATYLPLPPATGAAPITEDPGMVLAGIAAIPGTREATPELDLLWHAVRAVGAVPGFAPVIDQLAIGEDTLRRVAATSLALFAATMDFAALHALTGSHWVRLVSPLTPGPDLLLRPFWQVIASLVPSIGFPSLPTPEWLEAQRRRPAPDWAEIAARAIASDDEHDISLVFSAREEEAVYGDPLYRVVAARRVGLID